MEQGWIYVLVNSSTPGLIKVGRTTRPPADRAAELSAATGVPTPFVVAFDQAFADCCEAERLLHAELDRRGLRVAPNREFFRGPPADIIRIVLDMAGSDPVGTQSDSSPSAERLCEAGDNALYGLGETLQDTGEALRCYKRAALRGSLPAYDRMGRIYVGLYGEARDRAGRRRALNVLKEGARRGNYYCYCEMAALFAIEEHLANFAKSWELFFARRADAYRAEVETDPANFPTACSRYISATLNLDISPSHLAELSANADAILATLVAELDEVRNDPAARQHIAAIMRWVHKKLRPVDMPPKPKRRGLLGRWYADMESAAA